MPVLKHLKTLQHVSVIIQIIFRKLDCGDAATSPQSTIIILNVKNFKFSDFNKELNEFPEDDLNNDRNMLERF